VRTSGGVRGIGVTFIGGDPPPIGFTQQQERPGRIEYLYLTEAQKIAVEEMNDAIDALPPFTRLRCQNPQIKKTQEKDVAYFEHIDYDERTPPTEKEAELMCSTAGVMCPLAKYCLKLGLALEADQGVWGGRVLVDGKDYYARQMEENKK
jgi:Transcription factor WhiB.